jgi:hypothetical protein
MPALGVVEALNVIEHIGLGLGPCAIRLARWSFRLERGEEAFHRSIVPDIARSAHGTGDAIVRQQQPDRLAGILASLIPAVTETGSDCSYSAGNLISAQIMHILGLGGCL